MLIFGRVLCCDLLLALFEGRLIRRVLFIMHSAHPSHLVFICQNNDKKDPYCDYINTIIKPEIQAESKTTHLLLLPSKFAGCFVVLVCGGRVVGWPVVVVVVVVAWTAINHLQQAHTPWTHACPFPHTLHTHAGQPTTRVAKPATPIICTFLDWCVQVDGWLARVRSTPCGVLVSWLLL